MIDSVGTDDIMRSSAIDTLAHANPPLPGAPCVAPPMVVDADESPLATCAFSTRQLVGLPFINIVYTCHERLVAVPAASAGFNCKLFVLPFRLSRPRLNPPAPSNRVSTAT